MLISKKTILIFIPLLSLFLGFLFDEDLSTGGSKFDFYETLPAVIGFTESISINFFDHTKHFPLHYLILSIPFSIFGDDHIVRLIYLTFSLLLPIFVYLNLCEIYTGNKINFLIVSTSLVFFPYFRTSAIWANAHLTALIFLVIANYFYIRSIKINNFLYKFYNILFLSLSAYCIQSYAVIFLFYLFNYWNQKSKKHFFYLLLICFLFSLPGFYLIFNNYKAGFLGLRFTSNLSYTVITNLSILFFFITFFLINKNNFSKIKKYFFSLKFSEIFVLMLLFCLLIFNFKITSSMGGGFFYKLSIFAFKNKILFFITGFFGLLILYVFLKKEKRFFYLIILINLTSISYYTSQKYFEPLLVVLILIPYSNFLTKNVIGTFKGSLIFYITVFSYFLVAIINSIYNLSKLNV